jgi:hypothetical protein
MAKIKTRLPSSGAGSSIKVSKDDVAVVDPATDINFTGAVNVTDEGAREAKIEVLPFFEESQDANASILQAKGSNANIRARFLKKGNAGVELISDTNTASGQDSLAAGNACVASGSRSIALGDTCVASATRAFAMGQGCQATNTFATAFGNSRATASYASANGRGRARLIGSRANAGNLPEFQYFDINADSIDDLTTGDTTFLGLQGGEGAGQPDSDINIDDDFFWNVKVLWIAVVESISGTANGINVGDLMVQCNNFGVKRISGTASITSVDTAATNGDASLTGSASMAYSIFVSGTERYLTPTFTAPTFTGGGTLTMRIQAQMEIVEISF